MKNYDSVYAINERFAEEFKKNKSADTLTKYVMSELLCPIEDFPNAIKLIKENFFGLASLKLVVIGAYLSVRWADSWDRQLLDILNIMYNYLEPEYKAIVSYINALNVIFVSKKKCISYLEESISYNTVFIKNRILYMETVSNKKSQQFLSGILNNVIQVVTEDDDISLDFLLEPQNYIDEYILGIRLSESDYQDLKEKVRGKTNS